MWENSMQEDSMQEKSNLGISMFDSPALREIYYKLEEMAKAEQMKLFRLARRLQDHGASERLIQDVRNEAFSLTSCRPGTKKFLMPEDSSAIWSSIDILLTGTEFTKPLRHKALWPIEQPGK